LFNPPADRPALYGLYRVEAFAQNGSERPPLTTDRTRWKHVAIDYSPTVMYVQMMDESLRRYTAEYERSGKRVTLSVGGETRETYVLECSRPAENELVMEGQFDHEAVTIRLKRVDLSAFRLLNSPFRWTGRSQIF
jgi:hypothetical protein